MIRVKMLGRTKIFHCPICSRAYMDTRFIRMHLDKKYGGDRECLTF